MKQQQLEYRHGEVRCLGQLIWDETRSGPRPGVVVFPEAFGLNAHAIERAERLARLGYVALAADPHGEAQYFADLASVGPAIKALYADRQHWRGRAQAALDALAAQPQVDHQRLAAIGFCFGGATALELARHGAALVALTTFHAALLPELENDAGRIRAKILVCHGAEDPLLPKERLDAVLDSFRRDQLDWQLACYGGAAHSFTEPEANARQMPGIRYHAVADARSWQAMRALFDEVLSPL